MANKTIGGYSSIHGTNPQFLIEKIVRTKVYSCSFWKEKCAGLNAESLVDEAVELQYIGGTYGGSRKPTPFICLILKMLQIQPELDIVYEFIKNNEYKYVRALGVFYLRLVATPIDIYQYLEPLYNDYRKIRVRDTFGKFELLHMDEFIDQLLKSENVCDTALPRLTQRIILEEQGEMGPRESALEEAEEEDDDLLAEIKGEAANQEGIIGGAADEEGEVNGNNPKAEALRSRSRSGSRDRSRSRKHKDGKKKKHKKDKKEKKEKKEMKKKKYRTRGSISRSRSNSRRRKESSRERRRHSRSRSYSSYSRSHSRSHDRHKRKHRDDRYDRRDKYDRRDRDRDDRKHKRRSRSKSKSKEKKVVDENSDEYWIQLRAKLGLSNSGQ